MPDPVGEGYGKGSSLKTKPPPGRNLEAARRTGGGQSRDERKDISHPKPPATTPAIYPCPTPPVKSFRTPRSGRVMGLHGSPPPVPRPDPCGQPPSLCPSPQGVPVILPPPETRGSRPPWCRRCAPEAPGRPIQAGMGTRQAGAYDRLPGAILERPSAETQAPSAASSETPPPSLPAAPPAPGASPDTPPTNGRCAGPPRGDATVPTPAAGHGPRAGARRGRRRGGGAWLPCPSVCQRGLALSSERW